jgi:hypothetical protein
VPYDGNRGDEFNYLLTRPSSIPYGAPSRGDQLPNGRPSTPSVVQRPDRNADTQTLGSEDEAAQRRTRSTGSTAFERPYVPSTDLFQPEHSRYPVPQVGQTSRPSSYIGPRHIAYPSITPILRSSNPPSVTPGLATGRSSSTPGQYPFLRPRESARIEYGSETAVSARPPRPPKIPSRAEQPPSPPPHPPVAPRDPSFGHARTEGGVLLRDIVMDSELVSTFVAIASHNTENNVETCALLLGKLSNKSVNLLVPCRERKVNKCLL